MTCPANWEYDDHPDARTLLPKRCVALVRRLGSIDATAEGVDTRPTHGEIFADLHPPGFPLYAGAYRGDTRCRCLAVYAVGIESDPRVGYPPTTVATAMLHFGTRVSRAIAALDAAHALPGRAAEKLAACVAVACALLEEFLRIHPYANGNGHLGRWLVCVVLARYGHPPRRWTVEERPPDPPYSAAIKAYRDGKPEHLERFVLDLLA